MVLAGACGGNDGPSEPVEIIGRDWTIPAGTETYKCVGIQVDHDMYISQFQTSNPLGEHHTVLTVTDQLGGLGGTKLGEYDCSVLTLDLQMLFASGVGTDTLAMPDGVAVPVKAGQYLNLNLHLFNTSDAPITGHSGILATLVDAVPKEKQAEMIFSGTVNIDIPPGQTMTIGGGCTFQKDATLFTYWPHMHQHATHQTVTFGDSSTAEMCFTGLYRYPKQALTLFDCTEGHP